VFFKYVVYHSFQLITLCLRKNRSSFTAIYRRNKSFVTSATRIFHTDMW
jgi:hypothetical protein